MCFLTLGHSFPGSRANLEVFPKGLLVWWDLDFAPCLCDGKLSLFLFWSPDIIFFPWILLEPHLTHSEFRCQARVLGESVHRFGDSLVSRLLPFSFQLFLEADINIRLCSTWASAPAPLSTYRTTETGKHQVKIWGSGSQPLWLTPF